MHAVATVEVGWRAKIRSRKTFQEARWQKSDPEVITWGRRCRKETKRHFTRLALTASYVFY